MWDYEPVRKIRASSGKVLGHVPSAKMSRMVWFESLLERDFIMTLDYREDITWFAEQPFEIKYIHKRREHRYIPDFLSVRNGRPWVTEVKPTAFADTEDNRRKAAVGARWCEGRDWDYSVVTEIDIRVEPQLSNIKLLTYYARQNVSTKLSEQIRYLLRESSDAIQLSRLCRTVLPDQPHMARTVIFHLAFWHRLQLSMDEAIGAETRVWIT
jgi:hypothetical protein